MVSESLAAPYLPAGPLPSADIVLYVDFDGVLQHQAVMWHRKRGIYMSPIEAPGRLLFEWAHHLEAAISEFPAVSLVLSSSWCVKPGYGKALRHLPEPLRSRFIGGTFHRRHHGADEWILQSFRAAPRWKQILADVERRKPRVWLALDDDVADWPDHLRANLVACDGATGLSDPLVLADLKEKLAVTSIPGAARAVPSGLREDDPK
ncbi:hypothetical protein VAR608DRAFT_0553 [Variovorax sp. HW608]|uniref:HAD domain-containing protein n=1 Tax=Variovorax sp. HW608 TaxID=1034889 RepID=UPI00081FD152|nr:HAD domain-containing protein [Variovorax sp. HW608]SCK11209.1 hypothetical protein VAR608DRAFT_0553 [Variovorax sp. HW608]